jgi:hypothetical protein
LWLARATLHSIHSIFLPSLDITHHSGGRDSISLKKLKLDDGRFLVGKVILGFVFEGKASSQHTVGLTKEKALSYLANICTALDCPMRYISKSESKNCTAS